MRGIFVWLLALPAAAVGWWGLYELVTTYPPTEPGSVPLFYLLLVLALTGTLAPGAHYLNLRLAPRAYQRDGWRAFRHSAWVALCLASWAWLRMEGAFNLALALVIALVFVAIEALVVRLRGPS